MSIGIGDNILNQTFHLSAQDMQNARKGKEGTAQFTIPDLDAMEETPQFTIPGMGTMSAKEAFDAYAAGKMNDNDYYAFQSQWASQAAMLPQGIGMTDEQLIADLESRTAPILFNFSELYAQFGINLKSDGTYDDTPTNRAALMKMMAYMDQATQEFAKNAAHTKYAHAYDMNVYWSDWVAQPPQGSGKL